MELIKQSTEFAQHRLLRRLEARLVLELVNHIAEGASYRKCKNCGRRFVRQRGRAEHRQHRTRGEIVFCSRRCAKTYNQRKTRERKRVRARDGLNASA